MAVTPFQSRIDGYENEPHRAAYGQDANDKGDTARVG